MTEPEKDVFDIWFYRAKGQGGNEDGRACRVIHRASGLMADSSIHRTRHENRKAAIEWIQERLIAMEKSNG